MSKDNPTKAERIAAAKNRSLRQAAKHAPKPGPQPTDEPLPWLEGDSSSDDSSTSDNPLGGVTTSR